MEHRSNVARQIKSKLLFYGVESPFPAKRQWSKTYIQWLREQTTNHNALALSLEFLIDLYEQLTIQIKKIMKKVIELTKNKKYAHNVALLKSIPGVGTLIAIEVLVELQDMKRFTSAEKIASYIGLTPSEYSTGQYTRQGRITRCGNKRVRSSLVESSWILIYKDPLMKFKYERLKRRKGGKRAIVAIARHLIILMRRMLITNEPYILGSAVS